MAALATCWASFATDDNRCAQTAKLLTGCMQKAKVVKPKNTNINYHLARLSAQVLGK
ncbi:hypothetical protein IWW50_004351 [Coemansia erecta]|nr:hypothetical protein IWW50_004351 [Coemansia erecta]